MQLQAIKVFKKKFERQKCVQNQVNYLIEAKKEKKTIKQETKTKVKVKMIKTRLISGKTGKSIYLSIYLSIYICIDLSKYIDRQMKQNN